VPISAAGLLEKLGPAELAQLQPKKPLAIFDRLAVFDQRFDNRSLGLGLYFIHDLQVFSTTLAPGSMNGLLSGEGDR
jgi:hypothetical protein